MTTAVKLMAVKLVTVAGELPRTVQSHYPVNLGDAGVKSVPIANKL